MDIEILRNFSPTVSTKNLESIMIPNGEIDDVIKCDFTNLLELKLSEVANLYKADKKNLKFRHESNLVISKYEGKIKEMTEFEVQFEQKPFFECGINYLGRLRKKEESHFYIRIPGEGTYDPASSEPYLSKQAYSVITGFCSAALYALRRGSPEVLEKIFKIFKMNKVYKKHKYLIQYMKYQIKTTFIESRETKDYGLYLKMDARYLKSELMRKEYEDLTMYLNLFEMYEKTEMFPSQKYWEKMISLRQKHENEPIVKFIKKQRKSELFLLPDPLFVSRMSRLGPGRELYDMRVMIRELENLERDYSKRLKEEMSGRKEQGTEMKDLVQPYFSCVVF